MSNNDYDLGIPGLDPLSIDPHGQAALILVESLIHGLIERSVLTVGDAVEIIASATEVQAEVARAAEGSGEKMWQSHTLLSSIVESLSHDLNDSMS